MTLRTLATLALLLVLAVFSPWAVAADTCEECVNGSAAGCCTPVCGACLCCGLSASLADGRQLVAPGAAADQAWHRLDQRPRASVSRDVFHVPKPTL